MHNPAAMTISALAWWRVALCVLVAPASALQLQPAAMRSRTVSTVWSRPALAVVPVQMQEGEGGDQERKRGRVAVIARPKPKPKEQQKEDVDKEANWKVLLHNDDVHTFEYCTGAIVAVVRTITRKKAHKITVQAHSMGTGVVTTTWKQQAKEYCMKLQKYGLTSSISPE